MMTAQEVSYIVSRDGLDFALADIQADDIEDPELGSMWAQAQALLEEIEDMLPDPYADLDEDEGDAA